jgi:hypothetical protein
MALTMRPTGLGSGIHKDRPDFTVFCGLWTIGRIYERSGFAEAERWGWLLNGIHEKPLGVDTHGAAPTLEAAKAELHVNWRRWLEWAKLDEVR